MEDQSIEVGGDGPSKQVEGIEEECLGIEEQSVEVGGDGPDSYR